MSDTSTRTDLSRVMHIDPKRRPGVHASITYHIERYDHDAQPSGRQAYYAAYILRTLQEDCVAVRAALAGRLEEDARFPIGADGGQADWEAAWADIDYLRSNDFAVKDGGL